MNMVGVNVFKCVRHWRLKNMALVVVPLSLVFFSKGWLSIANLRTQQTSTHTHTYISTAEKIFPDASTQCFISTHHTLSGQSSILAQSIQEVLVCCPLVCLCHVRCLPVLQFRLSLTLLWRTQHEAQLKAPHQAGREKASQHRALLSLLHATSNQ